MPEANVKTNRMVSTKRNYHKEWNFASNYFIFFKKNVTVLFSCEYPEVIKTKTVEINNEWLYFFVGELGKHLPFF